MAGEIEIGGSFSNYRIVSKIGEGGMGEVYLANDTTLERQVALKVLLAEVANDEDRVQRFVREAKAASALNHPNILTVFEIGTFDGAQYIATELIKGKTLRELMRSGTMSVNEALRIALQVSAALGAAHLAGIVHRDIKPENIMVREDGLVKVLDFGLAKLTERSAATASPEDATRAQFNTQPGLIMGTVAYMSPEQARGMELDARSDIFSLGIVMYELFTGKAPFAGDSQMDVISSILKDDPPPLRHYAPTFPRQLERIVDKTLRKDVNHRYQHDKDLEIDLEDLLDELKFEAKLSKTAGQLTPAADAGTREVRPSLTESISTTRRFTLLHAILFVLVAAVVIGAAWYFRFGSRGPAGVAGTFKSVEIANWSSAPGELFGNAAFSPDGKMIAFSSTKSGSKNIWVTQYASTEAIQVTNDNFSNKDPIWSPKGDEIAFFSQKGNIPDGKTNATGIWRVSALGGTPKSVGPVSDGSFELRRWAASGKIYYQSKGDLHAMEIANGSSQKVTSFDPSIGKVDWVTISADERSIAYVVQKDAKWLIFSSDAENTAPKKVAESAGEITGVAWNAEMGQFFYSAATDGVYQVFMVRTSSAPVQLTANDSDNIVVDATADGRSLMISSAKEESAIWRVNLADSQETPVSRSVNSELWPSISPDGERVAFQSARNLSRGNNLFNSSILVKSLKARDDRPTPLAEHGFLTAWSPNGSSIAFMRRVDDSVELMTVNPNGGGEQRLTSGGIPAIGYSVSPYNHIQSNAFAWSPDGSKIAYVSSRNGAANIWTVSVSDNSDTPVTENLGTDISYYCPIWSSDGRRLAFFTQKKSVNENSRTIRGLSIVDLASKKVTEVFAAETIFRLIGWTAEENGLIIAESEVQSGLPPETALKKVDVGTGKASIITGVKNAYFYNIFLSPDRKYIGYAARNNGKDDIWLIPAIGGEPRRLTGNNDSSLYYSRLSWQPDGNAIVFGKQSRFSLLSMMTNID